MERKIAEALYEDAKDMDWMEYEEYRETEIDCIAEDLKKMDHNSGLWLCLENIYGGN